MFKTSDKNYQSAKEGKKVKPYWNIRGRERLISHNESYAHYQNVMHGISTCANKTAILKRAQANKAPNSGKGKSVKTYY